MRHNLRRLILVLLAPCMLVAAAKPTVKTSKYTIGPAVQPLVIIGEGWMQQFTFINVDYYDGDPLVGTLRFYTAAGQRWMVPIRNRGLVDHIDISINSGQMLVLETEVSLAPQQLGWAHFDMTTAQILSNGIYHAFTVYRKQTAGAPDLMTSVPFVDDLEDQWIIPLDTASGKYPGIGLVNSSSSVKNTYVLQVYDTAGSIRKTITKTVSPLQLAWFSLIGENPDLASVNGQIKVTGGFLSSAVFTLQFAPNGAFTALPVVSTYGMR